MRAFSFFSSISGRNPRKIAVILLSATLWLAGCSTPSLRQITVTPAPGTEVLTSVGQTVQYTATGSYQQGTHPVTTQNITSAVTWSSSNTSVATVNSTGVVTAVGSGTSTITATGNGQNGMLSGSSNVTVSLSTTTGSTRTLSSLTIIPGAQTVTHLGETNQYLAIGSFTTGPTTQDLTTQVTWGSSDVAVARIDATGLATSTGNGSTTITAIYTPAAGAASQSITTATAAFSSNASGTETLPTITVYKVGLNPNSGSVTGYYYLPDSGSPGTKISSIACTPNAPAASCTASVPVGVVVTLNTTTTTNFGGWSNNCLPVPGDAFTCTIAVPAPNTQTGALGDVTVGAIFN